MSHLPLCNYFIVCVRRNSEWKRSELKIYSHSYTCVSQCFIHVSAFASARQFSASTYTYNLYCFLSIKFL